MGNLKKQQCKRVAKIFARQLLMNKAVEAINLADNLTEDDKQEIQREIENVANRIYKEDSANTPYLTAIIENVRKDG